MLKVTKIPALSYTWDALAARVAATRPTGPSQRGQPHRPDQHVLAASNEARAFLALLVAADLVFVGLHVMHQRGRLADPNFSITKGGGFGELVEYVKECGIAVLLLTLARLPPVYRQPGLVNLVRGLLLDDASALHERLGPRISAALGLPGVLGLRARDLGELFVFPSAGVAFVSWLGGALYWRGSRGVDLTKTPRPTHRARRVRCRNGCRP